MSDRNAEFKSQQHAKRISRSADQVGAVDFFNLLTGPELLEMTDSLLPEHRERLYPPTLALSMFMGQVLSQDGSCQKAVDSWAAQRAVQGAPALAARDGERARAVRSSAVERPRANRMALARPLREIGRWHRDSDARYGDEPGLLSAAHEPGDRSGLAAGALGGSDLLVHRSVDRCGDGTARG